VPLMKSCRARPDTMSAAPSPNTPRCLVIPCPVLHRFQPPSCSSTPHRISHSPAYAFPWLRLLMPGPDSHQVTREQRTSLLLCPSSPYPYHAGCTPGSWRRECFRGMLNGLVSPRATTVVVPRKSDQLQLTRPWDFGLPSPSLALGAGKAIYLRVVVGPSSFVTTSYVIFDMLAACQGVVDWYG
jgi:hypothetical protein